MGGVVTLQYKAYAADRTKGHSCSSLLRAPQHQLCNSVSWSKFIRLKNFERITEH